MTCREFAEFLDAYFAGALAPAEQAEFQRHVAACPPCVAYLASYGKTIDICNRLGKQQHDVPADVPEELVRAILAARKRS